MLCLETRESASSGPPTPPNIPGVPLPPGWSQVVAFVMSWCSRKRFLFSGALRAILANDRSQVGGGVPREPSGYSRVGQKSRVTGTHPVTGRPVVLRGRVGRPHASPALRPWQGAILLDGASACFLGEASPPAPTGWREREGQRFSAGAEERRKPVLGRPRLPGGSGGGLHLTDWLALGDRVVSQEARSLTFRFPLLWGPSLWSPPPAVPRGGLGSSGRCRAVLGWLCAPWRSWGSGSC